MSTLDTNILAPTSPSGVYRTCLHCNKNLTSQYSVPTSCADCITAKVEKPSKPSKPKRETILEEAARITSADRRIEYGPVSESFQTTANLWSAILKRPVTAEQVVLMMIALKIARQMAGYKRDSLVDIAGYARTGEMLHDGE